VHAEVAFDLEVIDIGGVEELEARYRPLLPVVAVDGEIVFTYFVDPDALRARVEAVPPAASAEP
jgi:hypothetical protein